MRANKPQRYIYIALLHSPLLEAIYILHYCTFVFIALLHTATGESAEMQ